MADKNEGGDKTEQPTPKRLKDARKKGDVSKSKEVTSTVGLALWLTLGALVVGYAVARISALFETLFITVGQGWAATGYAGAVRTIGGQAIEVGLLLVAMLVVPATLVGLLTDFLQAGPVLTFEKLKPKLDHMNPVEGVKRMFTMDNLIEVLKAVAKTALLFAIGWLVVRSALPQIVGLARSPDLPPRAVGELLWALTLKAMAWTVAIFALVSVLDAAWTRYSFIKKMRMSIRDIKQEMKDSEGDPHVKAQRKQAHMEWTQRNAAQAARTANALIVNPTHVAIAIDYDKETSPVPTIAAKGEDHLAREMREAAEDAGVPIVRNIALARDLLARGEVGEVIPQDLFDIIAEVILWAREVREDIESQREGALAQPARRRIKAPGEDMTRYPDAPWNPSH
jgi:type III secretion protein U